MNTYRVMLCGALCLPLGALLFTKAWSAPTPTTPLENPAAKQDDLHATIKSIRVKPAPAPIDLKKSPDEIYQILQQNEDLDRYATSFSIILPTLSGSKQYIDRSSYTVVKLWYKSAGKWVEVKDKAFIDKMNESGSFVNAIATLRNNRWFLAGRAYSPKEGTWKMQVEGDLELVEKSTWAKKIGTCDFTIETRNQMAAAIPPEVIARLTPQVARLEWRENNGAWQKVKPNQLFEIRQSTDYTHPQSLQFRAIPATKSREWPVPYVIPNWQISRGVLKTNRKLTDISLPYNLQFPIDSSVYEKKDQYSYRLRTSTDDSDVFNIRVSTTNTVTARVKVLPDPTPTPLPTPTPFPTPFAIPTPIYAPLPKVPPVTLPQTFTKPMDLYMSVTTSPQNYEASTILWLDKQKDTSRIQQFARLNLNARVAGVSNRKTGNLKVRWHTTGGQFFEYQMDDPKLAFTTNYSNMNGRTEANFGARKPGKYFIYAEVLSPDGKVYAKSDPIEIEVKIVGNRVEIVYGKWMLVEGDDDLYSRKIWAYYIRDNEDIIQNTTLSSPSTPLNLTVELYDGSPISQKVSWLDKTQVNTPTNNNIQSFPREEDQPMATQFFRYNPVMVGSHDLNAYFVKGVKR